MLLGSGELGKEFVIAAKRMGQYVIAVDNYKNAPAMQLADDFEVTDMLNAKELSKIINKHQPDIIVPEIEAIRTEQLYDFEEKGIQVVPSAKAVNFTMNRKLIRDIAAKELGLKTAAYQYADTKDSFIKAVKKIGYPCVSKPLMSSSGKGQSIIREEIDILDAWETAIESSRGDIKEVIIEEFIRFDSEITLLTVTQKKGAILFCPPIGHRQERGDYMESWQPEYMKPALLEKAKEMAEKVTKALGGAGLWGVEFFICEDEVYFSELSPRPHDTGMVTLAGTQNLNEFELHFRALIGLPIHQITLERAAASAVILAADDSNEMPSYDGLPQALELKKSDIRIFGKPFTKKYRRMGISLVYDDVDTEIHELRRKARSAAKQISVNKK